MELVCGLGKKKRRRRKKKKTWEKLAPKDFFLPGCGNEEEGRREEKIIRKIPYLFHENTSMYSK